MMYEFNILGTLLVLLKRRKLYMLSIKVDIHFKSYQNNNYDEIN